MPQTPPQVADIHLELDDTTAIDDPARLAVGKTGILLRPPQPLAGLSIVIERERQPNDSLVNGLGAVARWFVHGGPVALSQLVATVSGRDLFWTVRPQCGSSVCGVYGICGTLKGEVYINISCATCATEATAVG